MPVHTGGCCPVCGGLVVTEFDYDGYESSEQCKGCDWGSQYAYGNYEEWFAGYAWYSGYQDPPLNSLLEYRQNLQDARNRLNYHPSF